MATTAQYAIQSDAARELERLLGIVHVDAADVDWVAVIRRAENLIEIAGRGLHHAAMSPARLAAVAAVAKTGSTKTD